MITREYIQDDKKYLEIEGGVLTGTSYAKVALAISIASALLFVVFAVIGFFVSLLGYRVDSTANLPTLSILVIGQFISIYILLLMSFPFYYLISKTLIKQKFVFLERR